MKDLKEMIVIIEKHLNKNNEGEKIAFNLKSRRHFFLLNQMILKNNSEDLRILSLVKSAIKSVNNEDRLYNSATHHTTKRRNQ